MDGLGFLGKFWEQIYSGIFLVKLQTHTIAKYTASCADVLLGNFQNFGSICFSRIRLERSFRYVEILYRLLLNFKNLSWSSSLFSAQK